MATNAIRALHPMTKFTFALFVTAAVIAVPSYLFAYAMFAALLVIAAAAGVLREFFAFVLKTLVVLLIIVFLMQLLFYPGDDIIGGWWVFTLTQEGLAYGLLLTSRILAIGSAFILFFRITEVKDFVKALENMGLPPAGAYVVLSTLQIIPEMRRQSNVIMDAQKTRGVETEGSVLVRAKAFLPTLTPLILSAIASTEERAITLESRAFSAPVNKTSLHTLERRPIDTGLIALFTIGAVALIVWRVAVWIL
ncbi:energy-coupling factor transporter transmembrane component T [Indiicoccus explosivorum]|uniref:energy-coupling factor transporter transmembrane component T n=1 Tax=Indiicoccus explosivorum TaxID=1917864 RepID=UPI000B4382C4|nr:energy-coupling factor transporter transmembrane component T [Indiicoccus explosivorum]